MQLPDKVSPAIAPSQRLALAPPIPQSQLKLLLTLALLEITWLWILPLRSSLWLDELITFWSSYKGFVPALSRSQFWPGQNMPYDVLIAAVIRTAGTSEIALRLPSLLASLVAAWLLFRLAEHFLDRETGVLVVVVFVSLHEIAKEAATNARPYGIGLMLVVASILQLVRWLNHRKLRNKVGFVLATAAIPYFHYLFATVYLVLLAYAIYTWQVDRRIRIRDLVAAAALIMVLLLPLAVYHHRLSSESSWSGTPDTNELVSSLFPPILTGGLFLGILISCFARRTMAFVTANMPRSGNFLFVSLLAMPVITLFIVARLSPFKVFAPRYYLPSFLALALIVGSWIRTFVVHRMRTTIAACIALVSMVSYSGYHWTNSPHREDWRAAAASVRAADISPTTPVLLRVGLVETAKIHWDLNIDRDSPLLCPLSKYPMPGRIVLLPRLLNPESTSYLQDITLHVLKPSEKFVLVTRNDHEGFIGWMRGWFVGHGFQESRLGNSQGVSVFLFTPTIQTPVESAPQSGPS